MTKRWHIRPDLEPTSGGRNIPNHRKLRTVKLPCESMYTRLPVPSFQVSAAILSPMEIRRNVPLRLFLEQHKFPCVYIPNKDYDAKIVM